MNIRKRKSLIVDRDPIINQSISRRAAISTMGKVAISAIAAGVIAGVGGYYAGSMTAPAAVARETTTVTVTAPGVAATATVTVPGPTVTVTETITERATVTEKVTVTETVTPKPTPGLVIKTISQVGGYGDAAIPIMECFNKRYGKFMRVEYETAPYATKVEKIAASLIAKSEDYHMVPIITYYVAGLSEHVENINDYIEKFKDDPIWSVDPAIFPEGLKSMATWKGKWIGLPFRTLSHQILFYRKDLYEAKGLSPPRTIEEYIENARALNDPPRIYGASIRGRAIIDVFEEFMCWMRAHGADILNEEQNGTTPYPSKHSETAERILEAWIRMDKEGLLPPGWKGFSALDQLANYQKGVVAQYLDLSPKAPLVEDPTKSVAAGKTGYVLFLKGNPEAIGPQRALGIVWSLCINKYVKNPEIKDAAYKLIVHMTTFESQLLGGIIWANGPTRADVIDSPDYRKLNPAAEAHLEALKILKNWVVPQNLDAQKIVAEEIHAAITGAKSVKKAVESMWTRIGALFR